MASAAKRAVFPTKQEVKAFENYFKKPKRGRGRPRKRQGKNKQKADKRKGKKVVDLTKRKAEELSASLDGLLAQDKAKRAKSQPKKRTNWDTPENAKVRNKIADDWEKKEGKYIEGDSFRHFCIRNNIDRKVLKRFLDRRKAGEKPKKRGRPTLLSYDVMLHLCEGDVDIYFVCVLLYILFYIFCIIYFVCVLYKLIAL